MAQPTRQGDQVSDSKTLPRRLCHYYLSRQDQVEIDLFQMTEGACDLSGKHGFRAGIQVCDDRVKVRSQSVIDRGKSQLVTESDLQLTLLMPTADVVPVSDGPF